MRVVPITLRDANALVDRLHRHHPPARGCLFCLSVVDVSDAVLGAAIGEHLDVAARRVVAERDAMAAELSAIRSATGVS